MKILKNYLIVTTVLNQKNGIIVFQVKYGNDKIPGTWKNGQFDGKGKIVDDLGNFEQGSFSDGSLDWQQEYDYEKLNGIWSIKESEFSETIYILTIG